MSKTKIVLFILLGALVHFGLTFTLILERVSCDIQPHCISAVNEVGITILGFPLAEITKIFFPSGAKVNGWFFILLPLNSLVAVMIIWFALVGPLIKRAKRRNR